MEKIKLGMKVKDKVTGFEGITITKCEYLNGCIQFAIKPPVDKEKGDMRKEIWIDEGQLEIVDHGILPASKPKSEPKTLTRHFGRGGGNRSHPKI